MRGDCQTNNTCFCTNGWKTCVPNDGTITSASAGCETYVYGDPKNCGQCGNVSASREKSLSSSFNGGSAMAKVFEALKMQSLHGTWVPSISSPGQLL